MPGTNSPRRSWWKSLSVVPAALLALVPNAHCPLCLGACGALAASLGVGVLATERVIAPLLVAFLLVGIAAIAWSMRVHRNPGPLAATVVASVAVICGRLVFDLPSLVYAGGAVLLGASFWNLWLERPNPGPLVQIRLARRKEGNA